MLASKPGRRIRSMPIDHVSPPQTTRKNQEAISRSRVKAQLTAMGRWREVRTGR